MSADPFSLRGRVALVTGANSGIGAGIALALAYAGADVVAVGRTTPTQTAAAVQAAGRRFQFVAADLSSTTPIDGLIEESLHHCRQIDILVNNAGIIRRADALDYTESDWQDVLNVNLKVVFFLSQAVARCMVASGTRGKIINIASMLSFQGGIRVAAYAASKSGVAGLTRALANEWASRGVNVNALAPGYIETSNTAALRNDPARSAEILARIPAGRWGRPDDLGGAAVFLASRAADYVHGAILPVDGGWLAR